MIAEELMIGDWVDRFDTPPHYKVVSIGDSTDITISQSGKADDETKRICWEDKLTPIPLTSEILEKNGFPFSEVETNSDLQNVYRHYTKFYNFPLGKGFYIEYDTVDNIFYITDHWWIRFKYVHEFQHVLKLCKIDKEISL